MIADGWVSENGSTIDLSGPIPWRGHDRSMDFHLNAWGMVYPLLAGFDLLHDQLYFDVAFKVAVDWCDAHAADLEAARESPEALITRYEDFAWYDMAVGLRCYKLAYMLDIVLRQESVGCDVLSRLMRTLIVHLSLLSREDFFRGHTNHGIYQALGQAAGARRFQAMPGMSAIYAQAAERVVSLLNQHFFTTGVHKEHSPEYHYMVFQSFLGAREAGLIGQSELSLLERIENALGWMVQPDGRLAGFGDTDQKRKVKVGGSLLGYRNPETRFILSGGAEGTRPVPGLQLFLDAGYAFARAYPSGGDAPFVETTYLAQIAGFHSRTHKHADHLSFVWIDRGETVVIDPGRYAYSGRTEVGSALFQDGFWYSDPKRVYVESTVAHNCVQIDGRNFPRIRTKPFGSALKGGEYKDGVFVIDSEMRVFRTIRQKRTLVLIPGEFLMILDWIGDSARRPHSYVQRFHLAPEWKDVGVTSNRAVFKHCTRDDLVVTAVSLSSEVELSGPVCGATEPELLGWIAETPYDLVPAPTFAFAAEGVDTCRFVTLLAFARELDFDLREQRIPAALTGGRFTWTADGRVRTVRFSRSDAGEARIETE